MGAIVLWKHGLEDLRHLTLLVTMPVYLGCAVALAFHPGVRLWMRHKSKASKAKGADA